MASIDAVNLELLILLWLEDLKLIEVPCLKKMTYLAKVHSFIQNKERFFSVFIEYLNSPFEHKSDAFALDPNLN